MLISCTEDKEDLDTPKIQQLSLASQMQVIPWGIELVGYGTNTSIRPVKVAVLDSGIFKEHEDLHGKVAKEYNAINPGQPVVDDFGHGTAVAGVITANDNDVGIIGVSQNVQLYDVKVLNADGKGNIEDLISAIKWCIEEQIDVMNISFGFQKDNKDLEQVIEEAQLNGIIVVAAAGNTYGLGVDYPARYDAVKSVNSINSKMDRSYFSAVGKVDFVGPGENIISTNHNGGYSLYNGTSFSNAYITGVISELINQSDGYKQLTNNITKKHTVKLGENNEYGNGLIFVR